MRATMAILAAAMLTPLGAADAQRAGMGEGGSACSAKPAPPPPEFAGWRQSEPIEAGATSGRAPILAIGVGAVATLLPVARIAYPVSPEKPGEPASYGGLLAFTVTASGRYRIGLGAAAWVDVVNDGVVANSVRHSHGADCAPVRKMVDFDLSPGHYLLQVAGNAAATLPLMVVRLP